jgi:demethylmenaquinone methyltransferase/2-methoxy-6-polyprenyl-1,4-benzoquinol methylase
LRVAMAGGRLVIWVFSQQAAGVFMSFYHSYQRYVMPSLVKLSSSNDTAYEYLNESINAWPDQRTLAGWIRDAGWVDVEWRNLSMGIVALHRARKPLA